ncbi:Sec-independent protein translocase protein TatB [Pseudomonas sp. NW5]|jgi:sec-independent protein translocase protein TatB|uniref:Sec-independent protein translocase protein TatB n=1 Tax=Pseudomonas sp. NW5 TaxID=2934934 RepID=UPI0020220E91|nr:Sec-independent protein translocase protein TatB [Pseudomonas sp. NW5]MCL7462777.1 Sec-independent protein translocase protein TatB [Pseudomonas sp. NW5]
MFDIGFSELLLVALVALLVLGPERLPGAARTAGLWIGRIRRSFAAIRSEVEREIGADEIRRQLHNENILALERQQQATQASNPPATPSAAPPGTAMPDGAQAEAVPPGSMPPSPASPGPSATGAASHAVADQPVAPSEPPRTP